MSWAEILKAQFLPGNNTRRWVEILGSEQEFQKFLKKLQSGDFQKKGMVNTLKFVNGDNFDKLISRIFEEDVDEDEAEARFKTLQILIPKHVTDERGNEPVSIEEFKSALDAIAKGIRGNRRGEKFTANLRSAELFARNHPKVIKNNRSKLRREFIDTIGGYLSPKDVNDLKNLIKLKPRSQQEIERAERARDKARDKVRQESKGLSEKELEERLEATTGGYAPKEVKYEYALQELFTLHGKMKNVKEKTFRKKYTVEPLDWADTEKYIKEIAIIHRALIPKPLLDGGLFEKTGSKYKLNPYFTLMLEYDTLDEVNANLNLGLREKIGDEWERLLRHHERIYPKDFVDWIVNIKFEDDKIVEGGDLGDKTFTEEEQGILSRVSHDRFVETDNDYYIAHASDNVLTLIERVWEDAVGNSALAEELDFHRHKTAIKELRESKGDFDSVMENYEERPVSGKFGKNSQELLDVLVAGGDAVGISLGEANRDNFVDLFQNFKSKLTELVKEKLNHIISNQAEYHKYAIGRKSKENVGREESTTRMKDRVRHKRGIFDLLIEEGYIS